VSIKEGHVHHPLLKTHPLLHRNLILRIRHRTYPLLFVKVTDHLGILILFMLVIWIITDYLHHILLLWFLWILCLFPKLQVKPCLTLGGDKL
jgi:hypothetical protein